MKVKMEIEFDTENSIDIREIVSLFNTNETGETRKKTKKVKEEKATETMSTEAPIQETSIVNEVSATVLPTAEAEVYTTEQIAKAMAQYRDLKGIDKLRELLNRFNAQALTQIPQEKYSELVTILNAEGVKI